MSARASNHPFGRRLAFLTTVSTRPRPDCERLKNEVTQCHSRSDRRHVCLQGWEERDSRSPMEHPVRHPSGATSWHPQVTPKIIQGRIPITSGRFRKVGKEMTDPESLGFAARIGSSSQLFASVSRRSSGLQTGRVLLVESCMTMQVVHNM